MGQWLAVTGFAGLWGGFGVEYFGSTTDLDDSHDTVEIPSRPQPLFSHCAASGTPRYSRLGWGRRAAASGLDKDRRRLGGGTVGYTGRLFEMCDVNLCWRILVGTWLEQFGGPVSCALV
jgi:hypothetical protein